MCSGTEVEAPGLDWYSIAGLRGGGGNRWGGVSFVSADWL